MAGRIQERKIWSILVGAAFLAVLFSVTGWLKALNTAGEALTIRIILDMTVGTLQLFGGGFPDLPGIDTPSDVPLALKLAQLLAPLATAGAVLRIGAEVLSEQIAARRISKLHGHTVICGHGDSARAFARSERSVGRPVVLVDPAAGSDGTDADLHRLGVELKAADALDPYVLETVGVSRAKRLIVAPEDDNRALDIAARANAVCKAGRSTGAALPVNLEISSRRLWRPLSRFQGLASAREGAGAGAEAYPAMDPLPFNMASLAAREFIWCDRLEAQALMRDQDRVHMVLIGYDDFGEALIGYLPPALVHPALAPSVITILAADPDFALARLAQSFPELMTTPEAEVKPPAVRDMEQCLGPVAVVRVLSFQADRDRLTAELMAEVTGRAPVTAVFVSLDRDADSLRTAMIVQDRMRQDDQWHAPINVRLSRCRGMETFLTEAARAKRFGHVIQPFGVEDRLCRVSVLEGRMDVLALRIHQSYQKAREDTKPALAARLSERARADWSALRETFRDANRRAADHMFAKLTTAGCHVPATPVALTHDEDRAPLPVPSGFKLLPRDTEGNALERLADLEHASWNAGRRLDGWRYSPVRDDDRQWHPSLVPYEVLADGVKQYDRDQVALLRTEGGLLRTADDKDGEPIRHDLWIGLIGKLVLSAKERARLAAPLRDALRRAVDRHPDAHVTLVTSLAPGADVVMTRTSLDLLAQMGRAHRLLVIEGVPPATLLDDYAKKAADAPDTVDGFDPMPLEDAADPKKWRAHLKASRAAMIQAEATDWVVELYAPSARARARGQACDHGHRRAARYIAERVHVLIAADRTTKEGQDPAAPGGVTDTLRWRKAFRASPPGDALLGLAPAALSPFATEEVVIDLAD